MFTHVALHHNKTANDLINHTCRVLLCILLTFILLSATAFAWGPERDTYTIQSPADHATFNSITDNTAVGDERNFVRIGEAESNEPYSDEIEIVPGKEYEVYIYYHNDAATDTNGSGYGVATGVKLSSAYPINIEKGERGMVSGIIMWSYVDPRDDQIYEGKVWDEAYITTKSDGVTLKYKADTAIIHNAGEMNGAVLPEKLFTEDGTLIGYNKLQGTIPGCAEYSGYITYTLIAEETNESNQILPWAIGSIVCIGIIVAIITLKKKQSKM